MKSSKQFDKIKRILGISDAELTVALLLILGITLGIVGKYAYKPEKDNRISNEELLAVLDSVSEVNKTTYVGSNIENEPVAELAAQDTVVKKVEPKIKKSEFSGKVNINTASKSELQKLYRIGEKTADKIIEYRKQQPFSRKEDIMKVHGIGKKTFESIKGNIEI